MKQILETMTLFLSNLAQCIFEAKVVEDVWNWCKQDWNQVPYLSEFKSESSLTESHFLGISAHIKHALFLH